MTENDKLKEKVVEFIKSCARCKHRPIGAMMCEESCHYEPKDEPQTIRCPKCGRTDYIRDMEKDMGIKGSHYKYKCINCNNYIKTEPTSSKMEQVDKDINVRSKDCETCKHYKLACELFSEICKYEPTTQTETQNSNLTFEKRTMLDCYNCKRYETEGECIECHYEPKDEPQTDMDEDIVRSYGFKVESYRQAKAKDEPQTERNE